MYYRGHLFSGYSNGSIKVWDIKGQTATLKLDIMEHKKAVTCFVLLEQGNYLLSGSSDKTIRIWQMFERKLHKMKAFDSSRKVKDALRNKHVKCTRSSQGKVYIGCMDSSIQELYIGNNQQQEIKAPSKSWTFKTSQSIHMDLEERLLACLCIYNYTFGRGMQKLTQLSEGVRESLRLLSSITWMAEELLKVADYYMPNKWRISCIHTQVLEANYNGGGATATLKLDIMEDKKAVTCFALLEQGNYLLSGSSDKTIRALDSSRKVKDALRNKHVKCIKSSQGKVYIGCMDSSIQELYIGNNRQQEIKAPSKSWTFKTSQSIH
nr:hypothetical protein [Tanacetum cinerariifolium]